MKAHGHCLTEDVQLLLLFDIKLFRRLTLTSQCKQLVATHKSCTSFYSVQSNFAKKVAQVKNLVECTG